MGEEELLGGGGREGEKEPQKQGTRAGGLLKTLNLS